MVSLKRTIFASTFTVMVQIEVKNIHKSFKSVQAVRGVSFDIQAGGFVALLGPTGAGKTTLVEIII
ncbi:MAG: ATP-binding cassette domain-containing protein [Tannerella sp.]|nr:ATP-binding cassette domain-containing protein [Tannerella sp.]